MTFKVGDKVKLAPGEKYDGLTQGRTYEVVAIERRLTWVVGDEGRRIGAFTRRFVLVKDEGIKIGDTVRVLTSYYHAGKEGVVVDTSKLSKSRLLVQIKNPTAFSNLHDGVETNSSGKSFPGSWYFDYTELAVVKPADATMPGTYVIMSVDAKGKLTPAVNPRTYTSDTQCRAVLKEMSDKHPGVEFRAFMQVGTAKKPVAETEFSWAA